MTDTLIYGSSVAMNNKSDGIGLNSWLVVLGEWIPMVILVDVPD